MTHYETLEVDESASPEDIRRAYRRLVKEHHPDKGGDPARFRAIAEAYEVLSDEGKRSDYDYSGSRDKSPFDMSDFFKEFVWTNKPKRRTKGEDIHLRVPLTFEEMCHGVKKRFSVMRRVLCPTCKGKGGESLQDCTYCKGTGTRRPKDGLFSYASSDCMICKGTGKLPQKTCETCEGSGLQTKNQPMNVTFPAGIDPRNTCTLAGFGHELRNGEAGDVLLELQVSPHEHFTRKNFDIHCHLSVGAIRAMVGGEVEVQTIHGTAKLTLPPGVQNEQIAALEEEGIHTPQGKGAHVVHIRIVTPLLTEEEQQKLRDEFPIRAEEPAIIQARKTTSWT